jgi:NTE family protein
LQAHRDYWKRVVAKDKDEIQDLDVYIINVHPSRQDKIPTDIDPVKGRINDITFSYRLYRNFSQHLLKLRPYTDNL